MKSPLPYLGMKRKPGFNCWDLIRLIYKNEFGINLPLHPVNVRNPGECEKASGSEIESGAWVEVAKPEANCVVLLGKGASNWHVGFILESGDVLHLLDRVGVVVQSKARIKKDFDNITFFRHAEIHPSNQSLAPIGGFHPVQT